MDAQYVNEYRNVHLYIVIACGHRLAAVPPGRLHPSAHIVPFRSNQHDSVPARTRSVRERHDKGRFS